MASAPSKLYSDDVSLVVVLLDTNPFFWSNSSFSFSQFLSHVLAFLNAILTLNQLNQVVVIATGYNSCDYIVYIYDSSSTSNQSFANGRMPTLCADLLQKLEEFIRKDEGLSKAEPEQKNTSCPVPYPWPFAGSPDGPEQYVAIMNSIFSAQRSMVPIDSCYIGAQNSAFLQQASYITGGVHHKPKQLEGLFQYLLTIFGTDLHSRSFVKLPKPAGVDFRASCFCHKNTINKGYICSVCLSIYCKRHEKCSTCGLPAKGLITSEKETKNL